MNEMRERFDKEFKFTVYDGSPDKYNPTAEAIKAFIEAEITRALTPISTKEDTQ